MEVSSVFRYHLSMFWRPAKSAFWTGWYSCFTLRASQVVWSFLSNGKTLLHVKNFSPQRSPCVDERTLRHLCASLIICHSGLVSLYVVQPYLTVNTHKQLLTSFWPFLDSSNHFHHPHTTSKIPRTKFPCLNLVVVNF